MGTIFEFLNLWRELITKVFTEHTLAASLVTIFAVGAFYVLQQEMRRGKKISNLLIVFVGWAILVPIVGFVMTVLGKVWTAIEVALPIAARVLGSFYRIYEHHPYLVLIIIVLGVISNFVWKRWWPKVIPSRVLRVACVVIGTIVVAHIASPIADLVAPSPVPGSTPSKDEQKKPPQGSPLPDPTSSQQSPATQQASPSAPTLSQPERPKDPITVPSGNPTAKPAEAGK